MEEVNLDYILNTNYGYYGNHFYQDCSKLFKNLYDSNTLLDNKELDKFIKKLTKGKSRSLIGHYGYRRGENFKVLEILTRKHLLTEKQVGNIISCFKETTSQTFQWLDNLLL